jgi:hypothetical protein
MKWMCEGKLIGVLGAVIGALFPASGASAGGHPAHPYRYSIVDMPVSLAVGAVRTPEFAPVTHWYWIMIQVEKPLPFLDMVCMMGVTGGPLDKKKCNSDDPLLRADWTVSEGDRIVAQGSEPDLCACAFTKDNIFKFIGSFPALSGKKYVVEVKFTKDGTPLNVANPHLIVIKQGEE